MSKRHKCHISPLVPAVVLVEHGELCYNSK
nr:MAG TPA: hypothetical protein [Caudoviricetes sp.]